jgi:hypothetical protein
MLGSIPPWLQSPKSQKDRSGISAPAPMKTGVSNTKDYKIDNSLAFSGGNLYFREYEERNI